MQDFQSTPPRRRRPIRRFLFLRSDDIFNPRLREGGDEAGEVIKKLRNFSIHASAKEATSVTLSLLRLAEHFQSTPPRRRRRQLPVSTLFCHTSFQSTPPRRRRRIRQESYLYYFFFNPRLREGGDWLSDFSIDNVNLFSIHASAKEATIPRCLR